jgi:hypothetical protein
MTPLLEDQLRAALVARAEDVRPAPHLADDARAEAVRLRRMHRSRALGGATVLVGVVALVPWLTSLGPEHPLPLASAISTPSPDPSHITVPDEAVPESVLALGRDTGALLATGTTIIDGSTIVRMPTEVQVDGGKTVLAPFHITALARAEGGYIVLAGPTSNKADAAFRVSYVNRNGTVRPLGESILSDHVAVSPDGLRVAFADAANGWEHPTMTVVELSGHVVAQRPLIQTGAPESLDATGIWLSLQVDPGAAPYFWNLETDALTQLAVSPSQVLAAVHGDAMVVDDFGGECSQYGLDVADRQHPQQQWSDCANANAAAFSPTGDQVATLAFAPDTDVVTLTVRDSATGQALAQTALTDRTLLAMQWTSDGQNLVLGGCCADAGDALVSVHLGQQRSTGAFTLEPKAYPPVDPQAGVVLGVELPLPSAG